MLSAANKLALVGGGLTFLISFWNRNEIPGQLDFDARLDEAPLQREIEEPAFTVDYAGVEYRIEPKYDYELFGLVVSYRQHDGESLMHRTSNDHLNMADVCVVWSDTAQSEHLPKLDFWNGIFTCNVSTSDRVAWESFDMHELSNNHLISNDPFIRDRVGDIRVGDQIRVKGWLAHYGAAGTDGMRKTSTTREDTGDGACETVFVNEFEIIEPAFSRWRFGMYLSLAILVAATAIHFSLPYRPYRD